MIDSNAVYGKMGMQALPALLGAGAMAYWLMNKYGDKKMDLYDHYYKIYDYKAARIVRHGTIDEWNAPAFHEERVKYSEPTKHRIIKYKKLNRTRVTMMKKNFEQVTKDLEQLRFEKRRAIEALVFGK